MKILKFTIILSVLATLSGCAVKDEQKFYKEITKNSDRYETLRDTEKLILGTSKADESIVLISYLHNNNSDKKKNRKERFIVSVYSADDKNPLKDITLEGHKALLMQKIDRSKLSDNLKTVIPKWFDNYYIEFAHTDLKKFRIIINTAKNGEKSIYFYKDRRYIVDKKKMAKLL